jgi:hypothetical protein
MRPAEMPLLSKAPWNGSKSFLRFSQLVVFGLAAVSFAVAQSPTIEKVSKITTQQYQTITIMGSGFGKQAPYTGDSEYISLLDTTPDPGFQAGYDGCLLGFCTTDTVTLIVNKWTNTKIVLGGFSGAWGTDNYVLHKGDSVQVSVFDAQTGSGPAQVTVTIEGEETTTKLASTPNPSTEGEAVTFTATVSSSAGAPPDGQKVSFMQGKNTLGKGTLSGGSAKFTTSTLKKGTDSIVAVYGGNSEFAGSKSKPDKQVVQ